MDFQVCFPRDADLTANEPIDFGAQCDGPWLHIICKIELEGKENFILVAEVH